MSLLEEVMNAVYSEVDGSYPSASPSLNWYGPGLAPNSVQNPTLGWTVIGSIEDQAMQIGTDYYSEYQIQFAARSDKESPQQAIQIIEAVKTLFRDNNNSLTLSTGRVLDIDVGSTLTTEASPDADGWIAFVTIAFETGT